MKKILIIFLLFHFSSTAQYAVEWGKYLNDSIPGMNFKGDDLSEQLAVDIDNNGGEFIYVIGNSYAAKNSNSFCDGHTMQLGAEDGFLAKYDLCGNLIWFRLFGTDLDNIPQSECGETAYCLAIDHDEQSGRSIIYVGGYSHSNYDPFTCTTCHTCKPGNSMISYSCDGDPCIFQSVKKSGQDMYLAKYDEDGNLLKWTYFGGTAEVEYLHDIQVFEHNVFITGATDSDPSFIPYGTPMYDSVLSIGGQYGVDAFLAEFDANLCTLKFFTYLGGPGDDRGRTLSVFRRGKSNEVAVYLSATTNADISDTSYHALNSYRGGGQDAVLSLWKLNAAAGVFAPQWLRYIGGKKEDRARELCLDDSDAVIIGGFTLSDNFISNTNWKFPENNFYDQTPNGKKDGFIAKFNISGRAIWATYYGGSEDELTRAVVRYQKSGKNFIVISGGTKSDDLPFNALHPPFDDQLNGGKNLNHRDAFIAVLNDPADENEIQSLEFASYFGGSADEWDDVFVHYGPDLALGSNREFYLTFYTHSKNIEKYISSSGFYFNTKSNGDSEGYLAKILNDEIAGQIMCSEYGWKAQEFSVEENLSADNNSLMLLYSNPTSGKFTLELNIESKQQITIELLNMLGQQIYSINETCNGELKKEITMPSSASSGCYVMRAVMTDQVIEKKLLYQK